MPKQDLTARRDNLEERIVFYLLVDRSKSMENVEGTLNAVLNRVLLDLYEHDAFATSGHFGVIVFNDEAELRLPVQRVPPDADLGHVECRGRTNVEHALDLLRQNIETVVAENLEEGYETKRPVACVLTDGRGNVGNTAAGIRRLKNSAKYPRMLAFGVGEPDEGMLGQLATELAWSFSGTKPDLLRQNLERFANVFVGTLIGTLTSADGEVKAAWSEVGHQVPMVEPREPGSVE